MKIAKNTTQLLKIIFVAVLIVLFALHTINFYKDMPRISASGGVYLIHSGDGSGNTTREELSMKDAELIHENQSGDYKVWQYKNAEQVLGDLPWQEGDLLSESAQFGISESGAEEEFLPKDRAQKNYSYTAVQVNTRTGVHDYLHIYFYPAVVLGNGETYQNLLLIMKEYY